MTYTFALLDVPPEVYDLIAEKLREAGYDHAFLDENDNDYDGPVIDMHGIGLRKEEQ